MENCDGALLCLSVSNIISAVKLYKQEKPNFSLLKFQVLMELRDWINNLTNEETINNEEETEEEMKEIKKITEEREKIEKEIEEHRILNFIDE